MSSKKKKKKKGLLFNTFSQYHEKVVLSWFRFVLIQTASFLISDNDKLFIQFNYGY